MDSKVAKRYALALYRTAQKSDSVAAVESDLDSIQAILKGSSDFSGFLYTPRISREDKMAIVDKLFSDRVTSLTLQALRLLLSKRREAEFEAVRNEFVLLRRQFGNVLFAKVTSAMVLKEDQKARIVEQLKVKSGKQVEAEFAVDPALIGGARVQFGNHVVDGTVRGSLNRLRDTLKYELLKQS